MATPPTTPHPTFRCYAELPTGHIIVPGVSPECPGPDPYGSCDLAPEQRPCSGATWRYDGGDNSWRFIFRNDSEPCPVTMLDPLGPLAIPQD